ncbi:MAG: hypothetical protein ACXWYD_11790 [Candidatus Binatia bacterium]
MMNARAVALITAALLSSSLLVSTTHALDPEKQRIYSNIEKTGLCGTDPSGAFPPSPCTVPSGQRLIIEHVSGYVFLPTSTNTTTGVSIVITDPGLGLSSAAFHNFVATKTFPGPVSDTFSFSIPFKLMLNAGATFYFSPSDNAAVSGYLVKQ